MVEKEGSGMPKSWPGQNPYPDKEDPGMKNPPPPEWQWKPEDSAEVHEKLEEEKEGSEEESEGEEKSKEKGKKSSKKE